MRSVAVVAVVVVAVLLCSTTLLASSTSVDVVVTPSNVVDAARVAPSTTTTPTTTTFDDAALLGDIPSSQHLFAVGSVRRCAALDAARTFLVGDGVTFGCAGYRIGQLLTFVLNGTGGDTGLAGSLVAVEVVTANFGAGVRLAIGERWYDAANQLPLRAVLYVGAAPTRVLFAANEQAGLDVGFQLRTFTLPRVKPDNVAVAVTFPATHAAADDDVEQWQDVAESSSSSSSSSWSSSSSSSSSWLYVGTTLTVAQMFSTGVQVRVTDISGTPGAMTMYGALNAAPTADKHAFAAELESNFAGVTLPSNATLSTFSWGDVLVIGVHVGGSVTGASLTFTSSLTPGDGGKSPTQPSNGSPTSLTLASDPPVAYGALFVVPRLCSSMLMSLKMNPGNAGTLLIAFGYPPTLDTANVSTALGPNMNVQLTLREQSSCPDVYVDFLGPPHWTVNPLEFTWPAPPTPHFGRR